MTRTLTEVCSTVDADAATGSLGSAEPPLSVGVVTDKTLHLDATIAYNFSRACCAIGTKETRLAGRFGQRSWNKINVRLMVHIS